MLTVTRVSAINVSQGPRKQGITPGFSKQTLGNPVRSLRPFHTGVHKIKSLFIMMLKVFLPFALSFPRVKRSFPEATYMCYHGRLKSDTDMITQLSPLKPDIKERCKM